ncbi:MAG: hypothetical protein ACYS99_11000 [Planctomycetota bacterium]|jgi:hypothetical protein
MLLFIASEFLEILFIVAFVIVAAIVQSLKSAKKRRRVRRHVERTGRPIQTTIDTTALRKFAEGMGFTLVEGRVPRVQGVHGGFPLRLDLLRLGGSRSRVRVALPSRVPSKLTIRPGPARKSGRFCRPTGHQEFDGEFRVICFTPGVAERVVTESARSWLLALGALEVQVSGKIVQVVEPGIESDLDRLRGLVELAVELARGVTGKTA